MRSCDLVSRDARAWAAAAAAALLIAACTDSHGNGSGTPGSTETGNPPVIDLSRVALVVSSDEVHVVGEPGAVTPASGEAVVETLTGGDVQRGPVEDDGSFDVTVTGTYYDTYVLHVEGSGDAGVSAPVYLNRGGATVGVPDGGTLSCDERQQEIIDQLTQAEARASHGCDSNSDCSFSPPFGICPYWLCEGAAVSTAGLAELDTTVAAIETSLCVPFAEDGCWLGVPRPRCAPQAPVACVDGQCTNCRTGECPQTTCAQCETPDISWSYTFGGMSRGTWSVTDCATFTHAPPDGAACSRDLLCIAPTDVIGDWSVAQLQNAVAHPDVTAALAAQATYGALTPAGASFAIRVGSSEITIASGCEGSLSACTDPPEGVRALREMLEAIATQQECASEPASACLLPFDPGEGPGTIFVYAFHPPSGTCVPQIYTGTGGNENRFDDAASCRAACPTTATESGCPPNRAYVTNLCLECGLAGGCGETTAACPLLCATAADCNGEGAGLTCGARGFCEASLCD